MLKPTLTRQARLIPEIMIARCFMALAWYDTGKYKAQILSPDIIARNRHRFSRKILVDRLDT